MQIASGTASILRTAVLDSFISYRQLGSGSPIVFLHGNPTSSYVWRKVFPQLCEEHRCLAPDLIGMGHSGKPETPYRYGDHVRYLDAWFEAMDLHDAVLVGYDWGGVLAIDWASRHSDRVRGIVFFETMLASSYWTDYPPQGAELFRALRTPGVGEKLVLEDNGFLPRSLEHGVRSGLSPEDRAEYYAPFPDPKSRLPMLQWTRSLPIDEQPTDVMAVVKRNGEWMAAQPTAKLLLTFEGNGLSSAPTVVNWAKRTLRNIDIVALGPAGHHAPEDAPLEISRAIRSWLEKPSTAAARGTARDH
jgi:haloalkane dehalogenase